MYCQQAGEKMGLRGFHVTSNLFDVMSFNTHAHISIHNVAKTSTGKNPTHSRLRIISLDGHFEITVPSHIRAMWRFIVQVETAVPTEVQVCLVAFLLHTEIGKKCYLKLAGSSRVSSRFTPFFPFIYQFHISYKTCDLVGFHYGSGRGVKLKNRLQSGVEIKEWSCTRPLLWAFTAYRETSLTLPTPYFLFSLKHWIKLHF
jgi:hypothetical protein